MALTWAICPAVYHLLVGEHSHQLTALLATDTPLVLMPINA